MKLLVTKDSQRIARWLRLMGHDAMLMPASPLPALYRLAYNERRTIITRDGRVRPGALVRVVHLESGELDAQIRQLWLALPALDEPEAAFSRCDRCNAPVEPVEKAAVQSLVPPYVFQTQPTFHRCPSCQRIYWAATHWQRVRRFLGRLRKEAHHA